MRKINEHLKIILILFLILLAFLIFISCSDDSHLTSQKDGLHILFLMSRSIGANNFLIRNVFEEYGWQVTRTVVADASMPCVFWGRYAEALPLIPEMNISEVKNITNYDCLFIAAAPGNAWKVPNSYQDLLESPEALDLISTAARNELPVFAMCAGVRVLAAAV